MRSPHLRWLEPKKVSADDWFLVSRGFRPYAYGTEEPVREDTHVSSVFVDAPFDIVWAWITNPSRFPTIHPNWTSEVTRGARGEAYEGVARSRHRTP